MTKKQAALKLDVHPRNITEFEQGLLKPDPDEIEAFLDLYEFGRVVWESNPHRVTSSTTTGASNPPAPQPRPATTATTTTTTRTTATMAPSTATSTSTSATPAKKPEAPATVRQGPPTASTCPPPPLAATDRETDMRQVAVDYASPLWSGGERHPGCRTRVVFGSDASGNLVKYHPPCGRPICGECGPRVANEWLGHMTEVFAPLDDGKRHLFCLEMKERRWSTARRAIDRYGGEYLRVDRLSDDGVFLVYSNVLPQSCLPFLVGARKVPEILDHMATVAFRVPHIAGQRFTASRGWRRSKRLRGEWNYYGNTWLDKFQEWREAVDRTAQSLHGCKWERLPLDERHRIAHAEAARLGINGRAPSD